MADGGAILKFPTPSKNNDQSALRLLGESYAKPPPSAPTPPPRPIIDSYDYEETVSLYQIATSVKKKGEDLVYFVDNNRQTARQAGIEMLTVQISSILEGEKFQRVVDALEDSIFRHAPISLSRDGADKVYRLEKLIAEADGAIVNYMVSKNNSHSMGQSTPVHPEDNFSKWIPVITIGMVGILGIIAIIALTKSSTES